MPYKALFHVHAVENTTRKLLIGKKVLTHQPTKRSYFHCPSLWNMLHCMGIDDHVDPCYCVLKGVELTMHTFSFERKVVPRGTEGSFCWMDRSKNPEDKLVHSLAFFQEEPKSSTYEFITPVLGGRCRYACASGKSLYTVVGGGLADTTTMSHEITSVTCGFEAGEMFVLTVDGTCSLFRFLPLALLKRVDVEREV